MTTETENAGPLGLRLDRLELLREMLRTGRDAGGDELPTGFDMRQWQSECGTSGCIAGWASVLMDGQPIVPLGARKYDVGMRNGDIQRWLGMPNGLWQELCVPTNDYASFEAGILQGRGHITRADAAEAVGRLIDAAERPPVDIDEFDLEEHLISAIWSAKRERMPSEHFRLMPPRMIGETARRPAPETLPKPTFGPHRHEWRRVGMHRIELWVVHSGELDWEMQGVIERAPGQHVIEALRLAAEPCPKSGAEFQCRRYLDAEAAAKWVAEIDDWDDGRDIAVHRHQVSEQARPDCSV